MAETIIEKIEKSKIEEAFEMIGYLIRSGAMESGNKVVLQKRLKQAGMRWSVSGAQSVLTLKSKYESRLWEEVV